MAWGPGGGETPAIVRMRAGWTPVRQRDHRSSVQLPRARVACDPLVVSARSLVVRLDLARVRTTKDALGDEPTGDRGATEPGCAGQVTVAPFSSVTPFRCTVCGRRAPILAPTSGGVGYMNRVALLALMLVLGCKTPLVHMEPLASESQEVEYRNGTPTVLSRGARFDVAVSPRGSATGRYEMGSRIALSIGVRNRSDRRIEVSESNITATGNDSPAPIVRATDIEDSILRNASWAQGMNAVSGALRGAAASSAGTTSYTVSGVAGGNPVHLAGQAHNQGAVQQAQRDAAADTARTANAIDAQATANLGEVATVFQRNTIRPGESYVGIAFIQPPRRTACGVSVPMKEGEVAVVDGPCRLRISVDVDGEMHTFQMNESTPERAPAAAAPAPATLAAQPTTPVLTGPTNKY